MFREVAQNAVLFRHYTAAINSLINITKNLKNYEGYQDLKQTYQTMIDQKITQFETEAGDYRDNELQLNWGTRIEDMAEKYMMIRNELYYTLHPGTGGDTGNQGEGQAITNLYHFWWNNTTLNSAQWDEVVQKIMINLDTRNWNSSQHNSEKKWVEQEVTPIACQHLRTLNEAYPGILKEEELIYRYINSLIQTLNIGGEDAQFFLATKIQEMHI